MFIVVENNEVTVDGKDTIIFTQDKTGLEAINQDNNIQVTIQNFTIIGTWTLGSKFWMKVKNTWLMVKAYWKGKNILIKFRPDESIQKEEDDNYTGI